jgi:hypothetical protein
VPCTTSHTRCRASQAACSCNPTLLVCLWNAPTRVLSRHVRMHDGNVNMKLGSNCCPPDPSPYTAELNPRSLHTRQKPQQASSSLVSTSTIHLYMYLLVWYAGYGLDGLQCYSHTCVGSAHAALEHRCLVPPWCGGPLCAIPVQFGGSCHPCCGDCAHMQLTLLKLL